MYTTKYVKILACRKNRSTATSVPHIATEIPLAGTGFTMRTERKKQHLLANYYRRPIRELVVPLQCCWRWTRQYLPLHWKTWSSTLIWQFQILKIEEHTVSASPQYRSEAHFQHTRSTANRVDWHETVYFHISTVGLTEEWSEEFSQFKVGGLIVYSHNSDPSSSTSTFCSYLQSGTDQCRYRFFWFIQSTFVFLVAGQEFFFSPSPRKTCFSLL